MSWLLINSYVHTLPLFCFIIYYLKTSHNFVVTNASGNVTVIKSTNSGLMPIITQPLIKANVCFLRNFDICTCFAAMFVIAIKRKGNYSGICERLQRRIKPVNLYWRSYLFALFDKWVKYNWISSWKSRIEQFLEMCTYNKNQ